jgi:hypothetical protein
LLIELDQSRALNRQCPLRRQARDGGGPLRRCSKTVDLPEGQQPPNDAQPLSRRQTRPDLMETSPQRVDNRLPVQLARALSNRRAKQAEQVQRRPRPCILEEVETIDKPALIARQETPRRYGDNKPPMIPSRERSDHVDHGQSRADDQDAVRMTHRRQRTGAPGIGDKPRMPGRILRDAAWRARRVAGANGDPIDSKTGSVLKFDAKPLVLASQRDSPRLMVAQGRSRRASPPGFMKDILDIGGERASWRVAAPERANALGVRQPFVVEEPAHEVSRIGVEQ